jgi:hypothetical protein
MKSGIRLTVVLALIVALAVTPVAMAIEATPAPDYIGDPVELVQPVASGGRDVYQGTLRIFMSEPESRYTDLNNVPYAFGFLRFADVVGLNINTGEIYEHNVQWDASNAGFSGVDSDNIVAQAVCFDPTPHTNYSDPPSGAPFFAYWADGAAMAAPGVPGQDFKSVDFTHTVFIEECTQKY